MNLRWLLCAWRCRGASSKPGLVHHSDRGSQYASHDYTDLLKANGITISMSRKGNPWDNAACESFMKTLKYEEVHRNEYRDLAEAHAAILYPRALRQGAAVTPRPPSSSAMSTHRLSLGGLISTRARLRFTGCVQCAMKVSAGRGFSIERQTV